MIFQKIGCQYEKTDDTVQTETYTDSIIHFFPGKVNITLQILIGYIKNYKCSNFSELKPLFKM